MPADQMNSRPQPGVAHKLQSGVRMVLCDNPSPMTYWGTNTFLLGTDEIAVIDPGPDSNAHLQAILRAAGDVPITKIIVTHAHLDHSPLAAPLSQATGAPVLAFGGATDGRSAMMQALASSGPIGGAEGLDTAFQPDIHVADGDTIAFDGDHLEVIHTPGHLGCHISLAWQDICFTGDHVMGWASSLVSPPDGDLTDFMASSARLLQTPWSRLYPAHGAAIHDPLDRLTWLINHRKSREAEILKQLGTNPASAEALAKAIYTDIDVALLGAATRNVLAHLVDLYGKGIVKPQQEFDSKSIFQIV